MLPALFTLIDLLETFAAKEDESAMLAVEIG